MTRKLKSTWGAAGASFLSFSKALCVCQLRSMFCESYLLLYCQLHSVLFTVVLSDLYSGDSRLRGSPWEETRFARFDQGQAAMPTCLRHVEKTLVLVSGTSTGSSLSPRNVSGRIPDRLGSDHEWPPCPWSVEWSPSNGSYLIWTHITKGYIRALLSIVITEE